jgi:hypothetical protein
MEFEEASKGEEEAGGRWRKRTGGGGSQPTFAPSTHTTLRYARLGLRVGYGETEKGLSCAYARLLACVGMADGRRLTHARHIRPCKTRPCCPAYASLSDKDTCRVHANGEGLVV